MHGDGVSKNLTVGFRFDEERYRESSIVILTHECWPGNRWRLQQQRKTATQRRFIFDQSSIT